LTPKKTKSDKDVQETIDTLKSLLKELNPECIKVSSLSIANKNAFEIQLEIGTLTNVIRTAIECNRPAMDRVGAQFILIHQTSYSSLKIKQPIYDLLDHYKNQIIEMNDDNKNNKFSLLKFVIRSIFDIEEEEKKTRRKENAIIKYFNDKYR